MSDHAHLESIVRELLAEYGITHAPIPLEMMLQTQRPLLWNTVDLSDLSMGFFNPGSFSSLYAPRMSFARMITRMTLSSEWGNARQLPALLPDETAQHAFARMLVMPIHLINTLPPANKTTETLSNFFEVPPADVELRMADLKK